MSNLILEGTIEIHAPRNRVWTILRDSSFIQQYMFGCVVETSWEQGLSYCGRVPRGGLMCFSNKKS